MTKDQEARIKYYRRFTDARNRALERMLNRYRLEISDEIRPAFLCMAQVYIGGHAHPGFLDHVIGNAARRVNDIVDRMRHNVYAMTVASSGEVFGRITGKSGPITHRKAHDKSHLPLLAGGSVYARTVHYLNKIRRKLDSVSELAKVKGQQLTLEEIFAAFPKLKPIKQKPMLQRMTESEKPEGAPENLTVDTISDDDWERILSDYLHEYVPTNRGPEAVLSDEDMASQGASPDYYGKTYQWELEGDVTHDFVQTVRAGENDAAEQMGITDFIVVSVIDNKTCEGCCGDFGCVDFDGHTITEIVRMTNGQYKAPPYHFCCRCGIEPVGDDLPDVPQSNKGEFDEWLNS